VRLPGEGVHRAQQLLDAGGPVGQPQAQHGAAVVGEHLRVAVGLRGDQLPEAERAVGDLQVGPG
jgi:hypothetical protein